MGFIFFIFLINFFSFTGFAVFEDNVIFDLNDTWNISNGFVRVNLNSQTEDKPLYELIHNNSIVVDLNSFNISYEAGTFYVDLIYENNLIDSKNIIIESSTFVNETELTELSEVKNESSNQNQTEDNQEISLELLNNTIEGDNNLKFTLDKVAISPQQVKEWITLKRDNYFQRMYNGIKTAEANGEPHFNSKMCPDTIPSDENAVWRPCSCGDGICASYEFRGDCIADCGDCPEGTVFIAGECIEFVPNTCINTVCEEGEMGVCPWDCRESPKEEVEEVENESVINEPFSLPESVNE